MNDVLTTETTYKFRAGSEEADFATFEGGLAWTLVRLATDDSITEVIVREVRAKTWRIPRRVFPGA